MEPVECILCLLSLVLLCVCFSVCADDGLDVEDSDIRPHFPQFSYSASVREWWRDLHRHARILSPAKKISLQHTPTLARVHSLTSGIDTKRTPIHTHCYQQTGNQIHMHTVTSKSNTMATNLLHSAVCWRGLNKLRLIQIGPPGCLLHYTLFTPFNKMSHRLMELNTSETAYAVCVYIHTHVHTLSCMHVLTKFKKK